MVTPAHAICVVLDKRVTRPVFHRRGTIRWPCPGGQGCSRLTRSEPSGMTVIDTDAIASI